MATIEVNDIQESKGEKRDDPQNVAQNGVDVAQYLDDCIFTLILETPNIKREDMAQRLSVTKKTIERHLKDMGISWEGHQKTGHWVLPKKT